MKLNLSASADRRLGLTRHITTAPLLQVINAPGEKQPDTMPAKPATKLAGRSAKDAFVAPKLDDEEDISRLPDSPSGSEDERANNNDITPTAFGAASSKEKTGISDLARRQAKFTGSRSLRDEKGAYRGTARPSPRPSRAASPSSSASTAGSTKRKSPAKHEEEDGIFKKASTKKAKIKYGSQPKASQKTSSQKSSMSFLSVEDVVLTGPRPKRLALQTIVERSRLARRTSFVIRKLCPGR